MKLTQGEIAEALGLDTTTVKNCQRNGMPHIRGSKGEASTFVACIAFNWYVGYRASRDRSIDLPRSCRDLSGPTDPLAFHVAVSKNSGDVFSVPTLQECLRELGQAHAAESLPERVGYFTGVMGK